MIQTNDAYYLDGRRLNKDQIFDWHKTVENKPNPRERIAFELFSKVQNKVKRFLDVGCYTGLFVSQVLRQYSHIDALGVDSDKESIKIAKLVYPQWQNRFSVMRAYTLNFDLSTFDCVAFKEVIEHIDRPVDAIREINRVLRPGGYLLLSTPNANARAWSLFPYSLYRRWKKKDPGNAFFFKEVDWNRHIFAWTPKTLNTLLLANGFEYVEHRFYGHSWIQSVFPETADGMIFLVRKVSEAPKTII